MIASDTQLKSLDSARALPVNRSQTRRVFRIVILLISTIYWQSVNAQQRTHIQTDPLTTVPVVGVNVKVSQSNPRQAHTEILAAADPTDPHQLLVCTMIWRSERNALSTGAYISSDGGRTWKLTIDDTSTDLVWDP